MHPLAEPGNEEGMNVEEKRPAQVTTTIRPIASSLPEPQEQTKAKAIALGLELSKRSVEADSLEDLFFILTNDIRSLIDYERALLIVHFEGKSRVAAVTNQPVLETRAKFHELATSLAEQIKDLSKGLFLSADPASWDVPDIGLSSQTKEAIRAYMGLSNSGYLFCIPLKYRDGIVGHLVLEFFQEKRPNQVAVLTLINMAPFLAFSLAEKWLLEAKPGLATRVLGQRRQFRRLYFWLKLLIALFVIGVVIFFVLNYIPFTYRVGGEADLAPREKHVAFSKIDGLVKEIRVSEGMSVKKGDVLALLDQTELRSEITRVQTRLDIATREMVLLQKEATQKPEKLAESRVQALKARSAQEELDFLKWKSQFLDIVAPVSGVVVTKDIQTFVGKRFKAGEPFCEIAVPGEVWSEVFVPEDKISYVKIGAKGEVYLNSEPSTGYSIVVKEVAPMAEAVPRLGNVFRVRAPFVEIPRIARVGMKGIGKIDARGATLWYIISQRLRMRWNQISLYL